MQRPWGKGRGQRCGWWGENSQPAMLRKTLTVPCSSQSPGASGIGSWLWLLPQSHIYAGVCRILRSYQASGWSFPYFTLILIKLTEVALQTSIINQLQHSHLNNLCSLRRKWLVLYAFWWCLWLPPKLSYHEASGYRPKLIQRTYTKASHWSCLGIAEFWAPSLEIVSSTLCWLLGPEESFKIHLSHPVKGSQCQHLCQEAIYPWLDCSSDKEVTFIWRSWLYNFNY